MNLGLSPFKMNPSPFKCKSKTHLLSYSIGLLVLVLTLCLPAEKEPVVIESSFFDFGLSSERVHLGDFPVVVPTYKYGYVMEAYDVREGKVKSNQTLGELLSKAGVGIDVIQKLVDNSRGVFNVNSEFLANKPYMLLFDKTTQCPLHFIFQPNVYEYFVFDLTGTQSVRKFKKPVEIKETLIEGEITSTLWETLTKQGISFEAASKMEDALQWSVDFSHTQKGDRFKMVYDREFIDGEEVGVGQVYAAWYSREGRSSYAIWFEHGEYKGFYDLEGRAIKSNFLKAPVKYVRISSHFNRRRFHPILKRIRPHLGTDYAAPYGTPIYAVGNGVINAIGYTKGNGRFIKIKHDDVYQTQYLHLSRFAKGMKKGTQVAQGQVIGYVGSSGLATGPHVCFRFWKNGKQVNHLRENLPAPKPLPDEILPASFAIRNKMLEKMGTKDVITTSEKKEEKPNPTGPTNP